MQKRQQILLDIIQKGDIGINELLMQVNADIQKKVSRITIIRDLDEMIKNGLIIRVGNGPAVKYQMSPNYFLFKDINVSDYFFHDPEKREAATSFNFEIIEKLKNVSLFNDDETVYLKALNDRYQKNIANLHLNIINKEFERLMIELSWKSSKIEGNTYDLLETEFLIKENKAAKGHTKMETQMILNHKDALNFIRNDSFKNITLGKIQKIHSLLTKEMGISNELRAKPVGITGTLYRPLQNQAEINQAVDALCALVNGKENIFEKSLLLNLLIAYIQPFNDGNKRTGRLTGNAILMVNNYCPLSFRSIDELEYKKAVLLFYEQNNAKYFKELFIEQYRFAVENYFVSIV